MKLRSTLLAFVLGWAALVSAQATGKGVIEGTAVRMGTDAPVSNVQVTLARVSTATAATSPPSAPPLPPPVTTGENGKFAFRDLPPGLYRLFFAANGYARQEYGRPVFPLGLTGWGTIHLAADQSVTDLVMQLTPTGSVSGRVRDTNNQPVAGVPVRLLAYRYEVAGRKRLESVASSRTNDQGEYRMYYVTPGRYYLAAGSGPVASEPPFNLQSIAVVGSPNESRSKHALTYHPGVPDPAMAETVNVESGADLRVADLSVERHWSYRIRGRIVDGKTGRPPPIVVDEKTGRVLPVEIYLGSSAGSIGQTTGYDPQSGTFELNGVIPATYVITARIGNVASQAESIILDHSDVSGITLVIPANTNISGKIRVQGGVSDLKNVAATRIQMTPTSTVVAELVHTLPVPRFQFEIADGTFRIDDVSAADYRVVAPSGYHLREVRFNQREVSDGKFQFTGRELGTLEIVLEPSVGRVDGLVRDERLQPVRDIQAVLIPNRNRAWVEIYRTVVTDLDGRFSFIDVPPGDYKIFAWEALEQYRYYDPEILKQFDSQGTPVRVTESSKATVPVNLIPAGGAK